MGRNTCRASRGEGQVARTGAVRCGRGRTWACNVCCVDWGSWICHTQMKLSFGKITSLLQVPRLLDYSPLQRPHNPIIHRIVGMLPVGLARDRKQPLTHPPATRSDLLLAVVAVGVGAAAVAVVDEAGGGHEEGAVVVVAGALAVELAGAEVDVLQIERSRVRYARGHVSRHVHHFLATSTADMCDTRQNLTLGIGKVCFKPSKERRRRVDMECVGCPVSPIAPHLDSIFLTEVPLPLTHFWGTGPSEPA
jgi:hypothetical protein